MRKIFIDGGGNWKRVTDRYLALADFDKVYVFEPNPLFYNSYEKSNYDLIKKAIWIKDTKANFFVSKDPNQVGSSLFEEKLCKVEGKLVPDYWLDSIEVQCLDFSKWIFENFNGKKDKITLKLDIEGAEYQVLQHMIETKSISLISKLFVEFHSDTLPDKKCLELDIVEKIKSLGIEVLDWD
jgi:FkbM family methyltransferase